MANCMFDYIKELYTNELYHDVVQTVRFRGKRNVNSLLSTALILHSQVRFYDSNVTRIKEVFGLTDGINILFFYATSLYHTKEYRLALVRTFPSKDFLSSMIPPFPYSKFFSMHLRITRIILEPSTRIQKVILNAKIRAMIFLTIFPSMGHPFLHHIVHRSKSNTVCTCATENWDSSPVQLIPCSQFHKIWYDLLNLIFRFFSMTPPFQCLFFGFR